MTSTQNDGLWFDGASFSDSSGVRILLQIIEKRIEEAKSTKDEYLPARAEDLKVKIANLTCMVQQLDNHSHRSLKDRIAYDQKKRLLERLKGNLAGIPDQQKMWKHVLDKAREGRKQAQRMVKIQARFDEAGADQGEGTEAARVLNIAAGRAMKATTAYTQALAQVQADLAKMNNETEYQRKVDAADRRAYLRAKNLQQLPAMVKEEPVGDIDQV